SQDRQDECFRTDDARLARKCQDRSQCLKWVGFGPQALALLPQLIVQAIERMTPPSTRSAAPVVAEACSEHAYTTMFATSSVVANRLISVVGRAVFRNCCSACS